MGWNKDVFLFLADDLVSGFFLIPTRTYHVESLAERSELKVQTPFPQRILTLSIFSFALGWGTFFDYLFDTIIIYC